MNAKKNPHALVVAICAMWPLAALALPSGCSDDGNASEGRDGGWDRGGPIPPPPQQEAGSQNEAGSEEAGSQDEAGSDTGSPGVACDLSKSFGEAALVPGLDYNIDIARLTADELTIYYNSFGNDLSRRDLFFAKRPDRQSPFGKPVALSQLNDTDNNDTAATISGDDEVIIYSSNRGDGWWRLFMAQRGDPSFPFSTPWELSGFDLPRSNLTDPALFSGPEGLELWFRSDGVGNGDIYKSFFKNGAPTGAVPESALNTGANELLPVMSPDRLTIYFGSNRPGNGGYDIWTARRPTSNDAFTGVTNFKELNTGKDEWPTWMSLDGCRMYLTSTRGGVQATYMSERPK